MKKKIIILILIVGAALCAYAYYMYNKPVAGLQSQKSVLTVDGNQLVSDYDNDETSANLKYLDKVITVRGQVEKIAQANDKTNVYLLSDNAMSSVICELDESQNTDHIMEGDVIKIKGLCTGFLMDVVLVRSIIL